MAELWSDLNVVLAAMGWWLVLISLLMFVGSLLTMRWFVARIPDDYFTHHARHRISRNDHNILSLLALACLKNLIGALLLVVGFIMLFTPGQGSIAILFGLMLMNYPGKYRLERWIISRPLIFAAINSMRQKAGKLPLLKP